MSFDFSTDIKLPSRQNLSFLIFTFQISDPQRVMVTLFQNEGYKTSMQHIPPLSTMTLIGAQFYCGGTRLTDSHIGTLLPSLHLGYLNPVGGEFRNL